MESAALDTARGYLTANRWLIAYVVFTVGLLYTQYFGALVVVFQGIYLLGALTRDRRAAIRGIWGLVGVAVLYLPWAPFALRQVDRLIRIPDFWKGNFQLSFLVSHMFAVFTFGQFGALGRFAALAIVLGALVGAAFVVLAWRAIRHGGGELYLLAYLLIPFAALYAVLVRDPKFTERYLIAIFPAFYLVFALAVILVADRARRLRWPLAAPLGFGLGGVLALALLGVSMSQLLQVYNGPGYRKDDNRSVYQYLEQSYQPGDVVVLMMNTWETLAYYTDGNLDWAPLQPGADRVYAANELNRITAGHKRMWLVLWNPDWADPTQFVRQSLDSSYTRMPTGHYFYGIEVRLYQIDPAHHFVVQTTPDHPETVDFGNQLQLVGYDLKDPVVTAGQTGKITLYWKALGQLNQDDIVSLRLTDGTFRWWQKDDRPAAFTYPTNYWPPGQIISGEKQFVVPPGTPPGTYHLEVQVYAQGGAALDVLQNGPNGPVASGIATTVAEIQVNRPATPPDVAKLGIPASPSGAFGDSLHLLGARLGTNRVIPGGAVDLTLWWQALRAPLPDEQVRLQLATGNSRVTLEEARPASGSYPTSQWAAGEVVVDRYRVVIPAGVAPGTDHLILDLVPGVADTRIDLGPLEILDHQRLTTLPTSIQNPTDFQVGSFARLVGYDVSARSARPGDTIHLILYWRANAGSGSTEYTVFAHVLNQQDRIFAQQDHPPGDGNDPTSGWIAGEYVVDHYDLTLDPNAAPGTYQIEVGMYDPTTNARLPVADGAGQPIGDRMLLAKIAVK